MVKLKKFPAMLTNDFNDFTYLKTKHFKWFVDHDYDKVLFGYKIDLDNSPLKPFTDLIIFTFILQYVPRGSRILDVGGGNSRVLAFFKDRYECWNIDKLQGIGGGPKKLRSDQRGIRLIRDYIGNFNKALPDNYFDFVFSISVLEHVPRTDANLHDRIIDDVQRVLKAGGYSLQCIDIRLRSDRGGKNVATPLLYRIYERMNIINDFISLEQLEHAEDIYVLPENCFYTNLWHEKTGLEYKDYGWPTSYQVLWRK
jgi:ubiquinone/menaquinone biosynthesis C-methylase UbiE